MFIVCNLLILIVELITHNKQMNLNKAQKVFKLLEDKGWEIRTGHELIPQDNKDGVNNDLNNYKFIACSKTQDDFNAVGIEDSTIKCYRYYVNDNSYYSEKLRNFVFGKDEEDIINNLANYFIQDFAKDLCVNINIV